MKNGLSIIIRTKEQAEKAKQKLEDYKPLPKFENGYIIIESKMNYEKV